MLVIGAIAFIQHERQIGAVHEATKVVTAEIVTKKAVAKVAGKKLNTSIAASNTADTAFWNAENDLALSDSGNAVPMPVVSAAETAVLACTRVKLDCTEKVAADSSVIASQDSAIKLLNQSIESQTSKVVHGVAYVALGAAITVVIEKIIK